MDDVLKSYKEFKKNIDVSTGDYIIGAISGGPDSMCLLSLLIKLKKEIGINVVCAHVNHKVRNESDDEYLSVQKYCKDNDVIFEGMEINKKIEKNFESEARKIRYKFFDDLVKKYSAKYLCTAHHGDDLMETILMRIVRGSNLKGYIGFGYISSFKNCLLIRPLISVTKADIIDYDRENNIAWADDYTNKDDSHTRNRYRKYVLPKLKEEDKKVNLKFLKFSEDIQDANNFIEKCVQKQMNNIYQNNKLNISEFLKCDHIIQVRILNKILSEIYNDDIDLINKKHVDAINEMIKSSKPNMQLNLPLNYIAQKDYNVFQINLSKKPEKYKYIFNESKIELPNSKTIEKIKETSLTNNYVCFLDSTEIKLPLIIRSKDDGDKAFIKNFNKEQKIKKIFIDSKLSKSERILWPIVTDSDNKIVWIPGLKKTKYDKTKGQKYDIILKYY